MFAKIRDESILEATVRLGLFVYLSLTFQKQWARANK